MSDGNNETEVADMTVSSAAPRNGSTAESGPPAQTGGSNESSVTQQSGSNGDEQQVGAQTMLPPPKRMPPPKFKAPAPLTATPAANDADAIARAKARTAAVAAAAAAAKSSLPAQRERAVAEAAARAYAAHHAAAPEPEAATRDTAAQNTAGASGAPVPAQPSDQQPEAQPAQPAARSQAVYEPPEWSGIPDGVGYSLEQIKSGSSLGVRDLADQPFYTFGRTPNNDVVLEHPSSSRLHAVLQFNGETRVAYLYDANSAHGTFLNRRRIKPGVHVPVRVGDMIKFGQSTRDWLLCGPEELMPEEGPSKAQRLEARLLKAKDTRRRKGEEVAAAQMEVALGRGEGVSWGFGEDATVDEEEDGVADVDWRAFSQTRGLTDKQEKLATKVRKKENTIRNLTTECERIRAKQALDELTAGQASTLARNERTIDLLKEEMEDLEETLNDSVRDSILGRKKASAEVAVAKKAAAERRRRQREEDQEAGSSDEDEFYDRTRTGGAAAPTASPAGPARKKAKVDDALDAGTLYTQAEALTKEAAELEAAIAREVQQRSSNGNGSTAAPAPESAGPSTAAGGSAADGSADEGHQQPADAAAAAAADAVLASGAPDALDTFMQDMIKQAEADKVVSLRKQLADVQRQLAAKRKLLKVADPDGYFAPGSAAAKAAVQRAAQQAALEAQRAKAQEQQRLARLAQKQREAELAATGNVEETEDGDDQAASIPAAGAAQQQPQPSPNGALPVGLTIPKRPAVDPAAGAPSSSAAQQSSDGASAAGSVSGAAAAAPAGGQLAAPAPDGGTQPEVPPAPLSGLEVRPKKRQKAETATAAAASGSDHGGATLASSVSPAAEDGGPRLLSRAQLVAQQQQERQAAGLAADLDALARARRGAGAQAEELEAAWQPPEQQKGDGRTALNDKFGY